MITSDFVYAALTLLRQTWDVLASVQLPGLNISAAAFMVGAALANISLNLLGSIFGFSIGSSLFHIDKMRGGNNEDIRVPDARKGDTK